MDAWKPVVIVLASVVGGMVAIMALVVLMHAFFATGIAG